MKKNMLWIPFVILLGVMTSRPVMARTLKASADKMTQEMSQIGYSLSVLGLIIAGIYFIIGRQDASTKMTACLLGMICVFAAPAIQGFIRGVA